MNIHLQDIGKKFKREWIIRHFNHHFEINQHTAILGPNGSGKSTLLQLIAASVMPTEGQLSIQRDQGEIHLDKWHAYLSFSAPYMSLVERLTLKETIIFHSQLKGLLPGMTPEALLEISGLRSEQDKLIGSFSSGMQMRIKNTLAILSNVPVVLLDEPLSNMDKTGKDWFAELISSYCNNRLFIVCSNEVREEYFFCTKEINSTSFLGQ